MLKIKKNLGLMLKIGLGGEGKKKGNSTAQGLFVC